MSLKITQLFVAVLCFEYAILEADEPKCYSRYDYDEKLLMKMLKIENEVLKFREFVADLAQNEEVHKRQRRLEREIALQEFNKTVEAIIENFEASIIVRNQTSATRIAELEQKLLNTGIARPVAFTVTKPIDGTDGSGKPAFETVVTNEGSGFDSASGKFTSPVVGLYFFTASFVKMRSSTRVDQVICKICHNGSIKVTLFIDPADSYADIGSYGVTNSVYLRLAVGDVVNLCGCSAVTSMDPQSSFSGLLVSRV